MTREKFRNLAASVRQRLFNRAQERHEDFGLVLTKYGLERFLYRFSESKYRDQFVFKRGLCGRGMQCPYLCRRRFVSARFPKVGSSRFTNMAEFDFPVPEIRDDNQVSPHRGDD